MPLVFCRSFLCSALILAGVLTLTVGCSSSPDKGGPAATSNTAKPATSAVKPVEPAVPLEPAKPVESAKPSEPATSSVPANPAPSAAPPISLDSGDIPTPPPPVRPDASK